MIVVALLVALVVVAFSFALPVLALMLVVVLGLGLGGAFLLSFLIWPRTSDLPTVEENEKFVNRMLRRRG